MLKLAGLKNAGLRHSLFYARENRLKKLALSNSVVPTISGTATSGQTLTVNVGKWSGYGDINFTYQWKRAGSNVSGATSDTYLLSAPDVGNTISVAVTATHLNGSRKTVVSASTGTVS